MYDNPDYNIYLYGSIHFLSNLIVILNQFVNQKTKQNKTKQNKRQHKQSPSPKNQQQQKTKQQQQLIANILFNPLQLSLNFSLMRH